jgi:transposase InsO family protein
MCKVFKVSRSSYYNWLFSKPSKWTLENKLIAQQVRLIYSQSQYRYGSPKITAELNENGIKVSRPRVARIMRLEGLKSIVNKKYRVCTTDSKHSFPVADNVLNREFDVCQPGKVWVSDITYIKVKQSWLYLTVVLDLFDRKVIGWAMSNAMTAEQTTLPALSMAIGNRPFNEGLIFHSDRGVQYACKDFRDRLGHKKIIQSMSRKGNCWDNAVMESFFKNLKSETTYGGYNSELIARTTIFEYIECWYNRKRKHAALGYKSPEQFGKQLIKSAA